MKRKVVLAEWVMDGNPTAEDVEKAGDVGFILCVSGARKERITYDHGIITECFYEDDRWYIHGVSTEDWDEIEIHGWMITPAWMD